MPLLPLDIPAGIYRNGTDLQSQGRWRDSNLVRWFDNTIAAYSVVAYYAAIPLVQDSSWLVNLGLLITQIVGLQLGSYKTLCV